MWCRRPVARGSREKDCCYSHVVCVYLTMWSLLLHQMLLSSFLFFTLRTFCVEKNKKTTHSLRCFCKRCLPPEPSKTPPPICCRFDFFSPLLPLFPSRAFCLPDGRLRDEGRQEINGCDGVIKRKIAGHHQSTSDAVMIIAPLITGNWKSSCQMRWWLPLAERERERQGWLFPSSACFASSELTKTNQGDGY